MKKKIGKVDADLGHLKREDEPMSMDIYASGFMFCSVCTDLKSREEIEHLVNLENPTGIESQWRISSDTHFKTGEPNPMPCEDNPFTHKHYLLNC